MFIRNGQALGSVHYATVSKATGRQPSPTVAESKKRGRPRKTPTPQQAVNVAAKTVNALPPEDMRTDIEPETDKQTDADAAAASTEQEKSDGSDRE